MGGTTRGPYLETSAISTGTRMKQGIDHGWHGLHGWFSETLHPIRVHPCHPWLPIFALFVFFRGGIKLLAHC